MVGRMDSFGLSDPGLVRQQNDDQFLIADLKKSVVIHRTSLSYEDETHLLGGTQAKLFLVADGVTDSSAGERASRMAVQSIVQYLLNTMHWLFRLHDDREDAFLQDLKLALEFTQEKIRQAAEATRSQDEMGTTITIAYVVWPKAWLIHVGDSRAYLFRSGELIRLTHDQTYAQAFVDAGLMQQQDVLKSPLRHVLSGLVGCDPRHLTPEITQVELALHDKLLLCTDGLTGHLADSDIAELLSIDLCAADTCHLMIQAANEAGGHDNTTVVLAHFTDREPVSAMQQEEAAESSLSESATEQEYIQLTALNTVGMHSRITEKSPDVKQDLCIRFRSL